MAASAWPVGTVARTYPSLSWVLPTDPPLTAFSFPATSAVFPGWVAIIMVTCLSPSALASARRSASAEPSLSAALLTVGAVAGSSAAKAMGSGAPAQRAATRPAATATRAARLAPDMGACGDSEVISIPVCGRKGPDFGAG